MRLASFVLANLISISSFASIHQQQKLGALIEMAKSTTNPVVVFDIDDTLIETSIRTLGILRDFAGLEQVQKQFPKESALISTIGKADIRWTIAATLRDFGIDNPELSKQLNTYWLSRFFGTKDCEFDEEVSGAASYVKKLHEAGAKIIYITGRPEVTMGDCTRKNLARLGLPLNNIDAQLFMKPDASMTDLDFKKAAFQNSLSSGNVIGAFENEPANLNAYKLYFTDAMIFFADIAHSANPERPFQDSIWIKNYNF